MYIDDPADFLFLSYQRSGHVFVSWSHSPTQCVSEIFGSSVNLCRSDPDLQLSIQLFHLCSSRPFCPIQCDIPCLTASTRLSTTFKFPTGYPQPAILPAYRTIGRETSADAGPGEGHEHFHPYGTDPLWRVSFRLFSFSTYTPFVLATMQADDGPPPRP